MQTGTAAIAASPHLRRLQVLELWFGRRGGLTDARLCRIMGASKAWPQLRELTLLNPNDEKVRTRKRLAELANEAAGREVAVYRRGWPELFPFAADFWYAFPGYLPDGRAAMAVEDASTSPPTLCVLTFDRNGKQTEEVLTVAFPDDLVAVPPDEWFRHKERLQQHLIERIGFRPGFIRIRDCQFPGDNGYNRPYWDLFSMHREDEQFGVPDPNDEGSSADDLCGLAGRIARRLRTHAYVFGWDRLADKRGLVHST